MLRALFRTGFTGFGRIGESFHREGRKGARWWEGDVLGPKSEKAVDNMDILCCALTRVKRVFKNEESCLLMTYCQELPRFFDSVASHSIYPVSLHTLR